jgi:hypothetical protein
MRSPGSLVPVYSFRVPANAPPPVAAADAEMRRIGKMFEESRSALKAARGPELDTAVRADVRAVVEAAEEGKSPKDPQANERRARAKIGELETIHRGHVVAIDEAGNRLVDAIAEHRGEWRDKLRERGQGAEERFVSAIAESREAFAELASTRGGIEWLDRFDPGGQKHRGAGEFTGGRLRVIEMAPGPLRGEHDPADLLALAARVVDVVKTYDGSDASTSHADASRSVATQEARALA